MHYYSFNIGDYTKKTAHLTNEEDLTYRRLLDLYYGSESPIPIDTPMVARKTRCSPDLVVQVLEEFFIKEIDGWHNKRADEDIEKYRLTSQKAQKAANTRWNMRTHSGRNANAMPTSIQETNIQEPCIQVNVNSIEDSIEDCIQSNIQDNTILNNNSIYTGSMVSNANAMRTHSPSIAPALPDPEFKVPAGLEHLKWAYRLKAKEERGDHLTPQVKRDWRNALNEH
jgi:uncharacterized protein YdaU (DUF1376 family)